MGRYLIKKDTRKYTNKDAAKDILGLFVFIVNILLISPFFFAFVNKLRKFSKDTHYISIELWDHISVYLIFILMLTYNESCFQIALSVISLILI